MATFPVLLNPSPVRATQPLRSAWVPAMLGVAFVAFTSTTFMGGTHSQAVLTVLWKTFLGKWHIDAVGPANLYLRKWGHFIGHGLLSLVFCRAWYSSLRRSKLERGWWRPLAGLLAASTTLVIASLDEWHQCYLPGRVGCVRDVLIDVGGALVANVVFLAMMRRRRPALVRTVAPARSSMQMAA